jgi:hypothetical protein
VGVFLCSGCDFYYLVGDFAVGLAVDSLGGVSVRGIAKAKDGALLLAEPVAEIIDAMLALDFKVFLVGLGQIVGGNSRYVPVNIHE